MTAFWPRNLFSQLVTGAPQGIGPRASSSLSAILRTGSPAINETFSPTGTSGQLSIGGSNVLSNAVIDNLIRTDWQGALALSTSARTTYVPHSTDLSNTTYWDNSTTITTGISDPSGGTGAVTLTSTAADNLWKSKTVVTAGMVGQLMTGTLWVRRRSGSGSIVLYDPSEALNPTITPTGTWQKFTVSAPVGGTGEYGVGIYFPAGGDAIDVYAPQLELGASSTSFIPNASATAASITDFSYTDSGVVTLGQSASGTYVWNGSGTIQGSANTTLAFTEAADTVALASTVTDNSTLAFTEAVDTFSLQSNVIDNSALAFTEDADTVALQSTAPAGNVLAYTETMDAFVLNTAVPDNSALTLAEAMDVFSLQTTLTAFPSLNTSLAYTEDFDAFSLQVTGTVLSALNASLAFTEGPDVAALASQAVVDGLLTVTEAIDVFALLTNDQEGTWLAFTEAADAVALQSNAVVSTNAATVEDFDAFSLQASATLNSSLQVVEAPDAVQLWTDGGNPIDAKIATVGMMANTGTLLLRS